MDKKLKIIPYKDYFLPLFKIGDVVSVYYSSYGFFHSFKGICIGLPYKRQKSKHSNIILRNVYFRVAMELCLGIYSNCLYRVQKLDFQRKRVVYRKSKLFYLRNKLNKQSIV
jgi:ribosomal protein L19